MLLPGSLMTGCLAIVAGGAGAAGVLYVEGALKTTLPATPEQIIPAAQHSFQSLKWMEVSAVASATDGNAVAKTANGTEVKLVVKRQSPKVSDVTIRAGIMGDEATSRALLDEIKAHLKIK